MTAGIFLSAFFRGAWRPTVLLLGALLVPFADLPARGGVSPLDDDGDAGETLEAGGEQAAREPAGEQLGGIEADRPGFATSTEVLGAGVLQLETGIRFSSSTGPGRRDRDLALGEPLLRLGLGRRAELRLAGEGVQARRSTAGNATAFGSGVSGFSLGAKIGLIGERGALPAVSVIPALSLPGGSGDLSGSGYDPSTTVAFAHGFPLEFSVGAGLDLAWTGGDGGRRFERGYSLSLGRPLPGGVNGFCELYRGPGDGGGGNWMFDAGLTRAVGGDAQLDISAGRDPRPGVPSWFVGVGLVLRRPSRLSWAAAPPAGRGGGGRR